MSITSRRRHSRLRAPLSLAGPRWMPVEQAWRRGWRLHSLMREKAIWWRCNASRRRTLRRLRGLRSLKERPTCRTAIVLKTGLEWFKLVIVCLIATLAWQLSRGTENPELISRGKWHLFSTLLNADTGDHLMEQEGYGSNEPPDAYDSADDCLQDMIQVLPPPQLDHITLLV